MSGAVETLARKDSFVKRLSRQLSIHKPWGLFRGSHKILPHDLMSSAIPSNETLQISAQETIDLMSDIVVLLDSRGLIQKSNHHFKRMYSCPDCTNIAG